MARGVRRDEVHGRLEEVAGMLREAARHAFELGGAAFARHSDELQHVLVKGYRREGVSDVLLVESLEYEQRRGDFRRMHARGPCEAGGDDGAQFLDRQDDMKHLGRDEGLVCPYLGRGFHVG